jgi:dipeptidase E
MIEIEHALAGGDHYAPPPQVANPRFDFRLVNLQVRNDAKLAQPFHGICMVDGASTRSDNRTLGLEVKQRVRLQAQESFAAKFVLKPGQALAVTRGDCEVDIEKLPAPAFSQDSPQRRFAATGHADENKVLECLHWRTQARAMRRGFVPISFYRTPNDEDEAMAKQIVAIGGGGFGRPLGYAKIEDYVLSLAGKPRPRVCFVPTASGDGLNYLLNFYTAFGGGRADAVHLPLHGVPRVDIRDFLLGQDVILVGGGNTANMLAVWRVHQVDKYLREAYQRGIILAGWSAGLICWFTCGVTDSFGPLAPLHDGLGFVKGSACPHYDGEPERRPTYHRLIKAGLAPGYAADDNAALHFVDGALKACVGATPKAGCYRVERRKGQVVETRLPTRLLA